MKHASGKATHPLDALLELVVDEEREVLGRLLVEVDEELEVGGDHLAELLVIAERLVQEVVEAVFQIQQVLPINQTHIQFQTPSDSNIKKKNATWT